MTRRFRLRAAGLAVLVCAVGTTAACSSPGPAANDAASQSPSTSSTSFDVPTDPVTLVVEDIEGASRDAAMVALNQAFMAKYPNVTIKRVKSSFDAQQAKQPLTLAGPNPPDVEEIAVNNEAFAKLANQGLIVNLNDYAQHYGWVDRFPKALLDQGRFDSTGQILSGPLYGIYQVEDIIGAYYNKKMLSDLGLSIPTTWDEFQADLDKAKSAGQVPMMLGNVEGWPAGHVYIIQVNRFVSTDDVNGWTFHTKDVNWNTQPFVDATTAFQKWGTDGYFENDFNAVSYDDAQKRFSKGEGLFLPAGTWITQPLSDLMGDNAGFFMVPLDGDHPQQVQGGQGQFWSISSKSKNQAVAAAYLDFITSQDAGKILVDNGSVPGFKMDSEPTIPDGLFKDVYQAIQLANQQYSFTTFEGTATSSMGTTETQGQQKLLVGKMTPEEYTASMQADYDKNSG